MDERTAGWKIPTVLRWALLGLVVSGASFGSAPATAGAVFPEDSRLVALQAMLPSGWKMIRTADRFAIESSRPIWETSYNSINGPDLSQEQWASLRSALWEGVKRQSPTSARFVFRVEPRWDKTRIGQARVHNQAIEKQLAAIAARITDRFKRGAEEYEQATASLHRQLIPLPYNLERYAVFPAEERGLRDELTYVFPEEAAQEAFLLRQRILGFLEPFRVK